MAKVIVDRQSRSTLLLTVSKPRTRGYVILVCMSPKGPRPEISCRGGSREGVQDVRTLALCLIRVPFLKIYCGPIWRNLHFPVPVDYRNSIGSKIDATHVIKAHSIMQFVMPWNAGKMNHRVSSNFLGEAPWPPAGARLRRACLGFAPSGAPFWWIGHPPLPNPRSATGDAETVWAETETRPRHWALSETRPRRDVISSGNRKRRFSGLSDYVFGTLGNEANIII